MASVMEYVFHNFNYAMLLRRGRFMSSRGTVPPLGSSVHITYIWPVTAMCSVPVDVSNTVMNMMEISLISGYIVTVS